MKIDAAPISTSTLSGLSDASGTDGTPLPPPTDPLDPTSRLLRRELTRIVNAYGDIDFHACVTLLLLDTQEGRLFTPCSHAVFVDALTALHLDASSTPDFDPDATAARILARIMDGAWEPVLGRVQPGADGKDAPYTPYLLVPHAPIPRIYPQVHHEYEVRLWTGLQTFTRARSREADVLHRELSERVADVAASSVPAPDPDQIQAAEMACRVPVSLIAGGPGTGKTTVLALILRTRLAEGMKPEDLVLAAPTGRAANRMAEAVRAHLPPEVAEAVTVRTLHRLLEYQPSRSVFRRGADVPLAGRHILVDEASMIDLPLMAQLVEALPRGGSLTLLGDPNQLPAVGVGTVFADLVAQHTSSTLPADAPAAVQSSLFDAPGVDDGAADAGGQRVSRHSADPVASPAGSVEGVQLQVLRHGHRNTGMLRTFSTAAPDAAAELLCAAPTPNVSEGAIDWPEEPGTIARVDPGDIRAWQDLATATLAHHLAAPEAYLSRVQAFRRLPFSGQTEQTDALAALFATLERIRILTAHARGATGSEATNAHLLAWWRGRTGEDAPLPIGTPLMIRRNDYDRRLFNGDIGILLVSSDQRRHVVFPDGAGFRWFPASVASEAVPAFALTIHKAQGSEYDHVLLGLPTVDTPHAARLLCREILYTGITRARCSAVLCADPATIHLAMDRSAREGQGG